MGSQDITLLFETLSKSISGCKRVQTSGSTGPAIGTHPHHVSRRSFSEEAENRSGTEVGGSYSQTCPQPHYTVYHSLAVGVTKLIASSNLRHIARFATNNGYIMYTQRIKFEICTIHHTDTTEYPSIFQDRRGNLNMSIFNRSHTIENEK